MIARSYIWANLVSLEARYQKAKNQKEALFVSKIALLELCGWIEESMDDIVLRLSNRCVKEEENRKYVKQEIIKKTHSFDYDRFRFMIIRIMGFSPCLSEESLSFHLAA